MSDYVLITKVGLVLLASYLGGRFANYIRLPKVSGYLAAGILFGQNVLGVLNQVDVASSLSWITSLALCIIGFGIGGSLELKKISRLGYTIFKITLYQAIGAFICSTTAIFLAFLFSMDRHGMTMDTIIAMSLVVGAISIATAPGTVMAVISETRARGVYTDTLLGVVALDDAVTLIVFSIMVLVAQIVLSQGSQYLSYWKALWPFIEIGGSVLIGGLLAFLVSKILYKVYEVGSILMVILGSLILIAGLSGQFHLSPILVSMSMGCFIVNLDIKHNLFFEAQDPIEDMVFGLFFALAGAHMDFSIVSETWLLSMIILVFRFIGKQLGVYWGSRRCLECVTVRRYLGLGLFPQAGVTIGLVMVASQLFTPPVGDLLINFILGSVIINELISPPLLKWTFTRVGESKVYHE